MFLARNAAANISCSTLNCHEAIDVSFAAIVVGAGV